MSETSTQERNQPASAKREREFQERGETGLSRELVTVVVLLAAAGGLAILGPWAANLLGGVMRGAFSAAAQPRPVETLLEALGSGALILGPFFGVVLLAAVVGHLAQGGLVFSPKAIEPRWDRLNPFERAKQILFSRRALIELLKAVLKAGVIGGITAWFVARELPAWIALVRQDPACLAATLASAASTLLVMGALGLAGIAVGDLLFTRWDLQQRMRMTQQEARQDFKDQEGDPLVRSRRRRLYRELTMNKILKEVPRADVVVTNPTHLAVALRYDRQQDQCPRVTAKGQGPVALRIRALARKHGVPVVENKAVARALHRSVRVGQAVKPALFRAVAEIYAFLYRRRGEVTS